MAKLAVVIGSNHLGRFRNPKPDAWAGGMLFFMESGNVYRGMGAVRRPGGEIVRNRPVAKVATPLTASEVTGFLTREGIPLNKVYSEYPLSMELERLRRAQEDAMIQGILAQVLHEEEGGGLHIAAE
jgi:hypothetical protein